jgi:aryl-alcohol dehydrogenase-like predicted oxidoreductase
MRSRRVGKSPVQVSEVTFGTGDTAGGIIYGSEREQRELVARAIDLGVTTFDCSPDYGKGMGEGNLGRVLRELKCADPVIITKVEIMEEDLGRIGQKIEQSINDSLLRLQRDHVDVLMLHNPIRMIQDSSVRVWMRLAPETVLNEVVPALVKLRERGKTRVLGLACETSETMAVEKVLQSGEFSMINAWYNMANPTGAIDLPGYEPEHDYRGLFDAATRHGASVAVIRPLAGGALTDAMTSKGAEARHALSRGFYRENPHLLNPELDRGRALRFLSSAEGTLSEAAYRYVLAHPAVCTVIGGFSAIEHINEAALAAGKGPLSGAQQERILRVQQSGFAL